MVRNWIIFVFILFVSNLFGQRPTFPLSYIEKSSTSGSLIISNSNNVGEWIDDLKWDSTDSVFEISGSLKLSEISTLPSNVSNYGFIYVKSGDSKIYYKDDSGNEYDLTSGGSGLWTQSGSDIYYNAGKVGIGTVPSYPLDVDGKAQMDFLKLNDFGSYAAYTNSVPNSAPAGSEYTGGLISDWIGSLWFSEGSLLLHNGVNWYKVAYTYEISNALNTAGIRGSSTTTSIVSRDFQTTSELDVSAGDFDFVISDDTIFSIKSDSNLYYLNNPIAIWYDDTDWIRQKDTTKTIRLPRVDGDGVDISGTPPGSQGSPTFNKIVAAKEGQLWYDPDYPLGGSFSQVSKGALQYISTTADLSQFRLETLATVASVSAAITDNNSLFNLSSTLELGPTVEVDTGVIASREYVDANAGLWQDTSDLVELKIQTPVKVPSYDQDSINIAGWSTNDFVSGIFVGEEQTKSGALFFDHTQSLSVSNLAPNTGFLTTHAGVLKYVAPEYNQFTMQYNGGYNAYIIPSTWYVDNKVSQALNNAKWSVYNTGLQQGTGIIISPLIYSATIAVDTTVIATQAYVDANAGGSAGLGTFQESFVANGTDSVYTLTSPGATLPTSEDNILVLQNGIVLDNDLFTKTSSTSIQLSFLPAANDRVVIVYFTGGDTGGSVASSGAIFQQVFIADGIDSSYTVDGELPLGAKDLIVTRNGLVLDTAFIESLTTNTVTLSFLPNAGNRINVIWFEVGRDTTWNKNVDDIYYTAGNVGIGTDSPVSKLEVKGTTSIGWSLNNGYGLVTIGEKGTGGTLFVNTPSLEASRPSGFGVDGTYSSTKSVINLKAFGTFSLDTNFGSDLALSTTKANVVSEVMRLTEDGNVGIGTTNPNYKLQVAGETYIGPTSGPALRLGRITGQPNIEGNGYLLMDSDGFPAGINWYTSDDVVLAHGGGEVRIQNIDRGGYNLQVNGTGVWAQGSYVNGSDIKLKENIKPINSGLYYVNKLKPVEYNYKPIYSSDPSRQLGFIAQDVIFALEDLSDAVVKDNGDIYSMAYQNLIPLAVKAIQEQQAIIETQNTKITELETALQALITRVEQLEQ